jgi:hypothetical protein
MGTGFDAAGSAPLLEPPGFMLRNYGRQTPLVTIVSHIAYGAIVGGFSSWPASRSQSFLRDVRRPLQRMAP